ncbi:MAG: DUF937 domain-containing protein [Planctomycetota bacterium]
MSELLDSLRSQLGDEQIEALSRSLGANPDQTKQAIGAAMPTLLGALARNASDSSGQERLHQALVRDHDGSLLDHLGGLFGGQTPAPTGGMTAKTAAGDAILNHMLGGRKQRVEAGISKASGLSGGQSMQLMATLAPMLMGILGKKRQQANLSPGGLGDLLRGESEQVEASTGAKGGFVARMLDQDGDGDFDVMDVVKFGMSRLFGR